MQLKDRGDSLSWQAGCQGVVCTALPLPVPVAHGRPGGAASPPEQPGLAPHYHIMYWSRLRGAPRAHTVPSAINLRDVDIVGGRVHTQSKHGDMRPQQSKHQQEIGTAAGQQSTSCTLFLICRAIQNGAPNVAYRLVCLYCNIFYRREEANNRAAPNWPQSVFWDVHGAACPCSQFLVSWDGRT